METRKDQKLKTRSKMETKEKNFEQDIESWLLTEGGYVKGKTHTHTVLHYNLDVIIALGYRVQSPTEPLRRETHPLLQPLRRSHVGQFLEFLLEVGTVSETAVGGNGLVGPVGVLLHDALGLLDTQS